MHSLVSSVSVGIAGMVVASAFAGCSDGGDEAMLVTKDVAPVGTCTFTGEPTEPFLPFGEVDPHAPGYLLFPQIESRITADITDDPTTMQTRTIDITDGDVDITFPGSTLFSSEQLTAMTNSGLTHFKALFTGPVAPNGGTTDTTVEVVSRELLDAISAAGGGGSGGDVAMQISLVVNGTMSGASVSSNKFLFPVTVTNTIDSPLLACPLPAGTVITDLGSPCNALQDTAVQCCSNPDGTLLCGAAAPIATM